MRSSPRYTRCLDCPDQLSPPFANVFFVKHSNDINAGFEVISHIVLHMYTLQELSMYFVCSFSGL